MAVPAGLIEEMTLTEKIGQLTMVSANFTVTGPVVVEDVTAELKAGRIGSLFNLYGVAAVRAAQRQAVEETRLGVPLFFGFDTIHGFRTVFPIPLAEAGAFDPALWQETAAEAGAETAEAGIDLTFAPMLDIARDPRWGRIAEGPGEDPLVASAMAVAKVRGFQGPGRVAATAKHFVGYGASAAGRDYAPVDLSERALAEIYLPPFRAAVEAGVEAVMPAFTDIAGVPLTADRRLLTGLLREQWGFAGAIISDYGAVGELIRHGVAADAVEAAALALRAGVDIDMMSMAYRNGLPQAIERGLVGMADLDAAVGRVLALKDRLGLFDDPYHRIPAADAPPSPARRAAARRAAGRSMVLLQNRGAALPLPEDPGRVVLIGPLADAASEMIGPWSGIGRGDEAVSVLAGLRAALPSAAIVPADGVSIEDGPAAHIAAAMAAEGADRVILCLGESAGMSGEAASRARIDLPGQQLALAEAVFATGKPVIVLLFSGRPIAMPAVFERAAAVLACWFPGSEAGNAVADILTGRVNPSAGLAVTWPRDVGQVPIAFAMRSGGRPENPADKYTSKYLDMPNSPQFAFGHGLSYTDFTLSDPVATPGDDAVLVEATLANSGARAGATTVFLFIRDPVASIARPVLELKRFERVELAPGVSLPLSFRLTRDDFAFPGPDLAPLVEAGEIEIHLGFSADPDGLRTTRIRL